MVEARVYDNDGNHLIDLEAGGVRAMFNRAQYLFGHCLGSITDNSTFIGWKFAHCDGMDMCSKVNVVNVQVLLPKQPPS